MHKPFVFFGTPYIARDTLAMLVAEGYTPSLVVTSPDAPRGRGMVLTPCETKAWALQHGLPVYAPERLTEEAQAEILKTGAEYAIVVAYGKILPASLIEAFPLGVLNIHYSLLPKYRGASPVEAALRNGDTETGVSIQKMVYELDAGDVLRKEVVPIAPEDTIRELRPRLIERGARLLVSLLPSFEEGTYTSEPQDHAQATRTGKIKKEEGELTIPGDDQANWHIYRALCESPGTYFFAERNGTRIRVKVTAATLANGRFVIERVIPEGKREMSYGDFVR